MTVYLVGAGPGDPGLLTRRAAELLARADTVLYDRLVHPGILALVGPRARLVDVGKRPAPGQVRQEEINELLVAEGQRAETVVRLKGGDPFVFGRGGEEAEALGAAGIPYQVVPGVSSAFSVPAAAGIPVTHRGLSTSVTVVTGHDARAGDARGIDWEAVARVGGTIVVLMGAARRAEISRRLQEGGRPATTPVTAIEQGTTAAERSVRTTLAGLAEIDLASPAVIVVGPVAAMDLSAGPAGPLAGRTVVVTRPADQAAATVGALAEAGARVIEVPAIAVADPDDGGRGLEAAAGRVAQVDWVAFTSQNGVRRFVGHLRDARGFGRARIAAVGPATAAALAEFCVVPDLVPARATAAELARALPDPPEGGGTVLFPRAEGAAEGLPAGLRARGWSVEEVVAYRTVPAPPPSPELAEAVEKADAVVFASASAVEAAGRMVDTAGRPVVWPEAVVCIGPSTAEAARRRGLAVAAVAPAPVPAGMVSVLAGVFGPPVGTPAGGP